MAVPEAIKLTPLLWPSRADPMAVPVSTSHKRTVLSDDPEASFLPSGEKAIEWTPALWPSNVRKDVVHDGWLEVMVGRSCVM